MKQDQFATATRQLETKPDRDTLHTYQNTVQKDNKVEQETLINDQMLSMDNSRQIIVNENQLISVDKKQPQNQNMKSEASYESKGFGFKSQN